MEPSHSLLPCCIHEVFPAVLTAQRPELPVPGGCSFWGKVQLQVVCKLKTPANLQPWMLGQKLEAAPKASGEMFAEKRKKDWVWNRARAGGNKGQVVLRCRAASSRMSPTALCSQVAAGAEASSKTLYFQSFARKWNVQRDL